MKKTKFSEAQIVKALKEAEGGRPVSEIRRELSINPQTFYNWKKKYSGMDGDQLRHLGKLEEENRKLKNMYADLALDNKMLKDVLSKKMVKPGDRENAIAYLTQSHEISVTSACKIIG